MISAERTGAKNSATEDTNHAPHRYSHGVVNRILGYHYSRLLYEAVVYDLQLLCSTVLQRKSNPHTDHSSSHVLRSCFDFRPSTRRVQTFKIQTVKSELDGFISNSPTKRYLTSRTGTLKDQIEHRAFEHRVPCILHPMLAPRMLWTMGGIPDHTARQLGRP